MWMVDHSQCETCVAMQEVVTPKRSRFLLCQRSRTDPYYPKYPPQPILRCGGYELRDGTGDDVKPIEEA